MADNRVKVLQVITGLGTGGAERMVLDLIREMDSDRFDVRLASIAPDLSALATYGHTDRAVEAFDLSGTGRLNSFLRMRQYLRAFSPDVIHAHMLHSLVASILARAPQPNTPAICFTSHNSDQAFPPARSTVVKISRRLRAADILFHEAQHPHLNCRNTVVIGNGVPLPDKLAPRRNWRDVAKVKLIAVGRLSAQKDPLGLIHVVHRLGNPRVHLDFFGVGPLQAECEALISDLNMTHRIRLHGISSKIRSEMRNADILVMHSRYEGMPMVLLEAGAEAMPVISTPVGSVPNLLGQDRGAIASAEGFVDALAGLIAHPERALDTGLRFHKHVTENFTIARSARLHESLYFSLIQKGVLDSVRPIPTSF